ncbi:hypothetical protein HN51_002237 [Arachis hypogaea]|uniref:Glutamine amidotransferase domain-containing protein n=2 Tax=Arachis TaxID=3817 RepID=A0A445EN69_ARAHY|nr:gamma-glutamyl peptidase 3 [Arachis duranensis]XP_025607497.1 gamma-glutamyl peptidase 3 [Arachis hypogaea]RYR76900.1 hypothetical protein Ahy_A01g001414 [Arachis hypogaea]
MVMNNNGNGRRYGLLQAAKDPEYVKKMYGGYLKVYAEAFGEEGASWDLFRVCEGEFPEISELHKYDGFVVSGSSNDAFGNDYWILKLCFLLQILDAMEKKILGICFGHQVLCRALGGRVGRAKRGWDIGITQVSFAKDRAPLWYLDDHHNMPSSLSIIEIHQDEIFEVPVGANVIASSDKTGVEIFVIEDHILGIQGHPEYNKDILFNLIDRLLGMDKIEKRFAEEVKCRVELGEPDRKCWEKICRNFLKGHHKICD